ncbi:MAG: GNAT family N-acetyltransferase [Anaerolineaceae bacterium]
MTARTELNINFPTPPGTAGLTLDAFQGEEDLRDLVKLCDKLWQLGLHDGSLDFEYFKHSFAHLSNCDLSKDFLLARINGEPVGYLRHWWESVIADESRVHLTTFWMLPEWLESPLGDFMINWAETRSLEVADTLSPVKGGDQIDLLTREEDKKKIQLLDAHGYKPLRYFFDMSRSLDGELPDEPLPDGLEVRPVLNSQVRQVWEASNEAFRDEWGATEPTEEFYLEFVGSYFTRPELWQVAWDGDEVAGMVMNYMDTRQNDLDKRYRGYTEGISVRRPYRGKGVASALICRSMRMFKALNMTEVALGVDAENPSGALGLYTRLGYHPYRTQIWYSKLLANLS